MTTLRAISLFLFSVASLQNCKADLIGPALYRITQEPLRHSECPSWDSRNNLLYFVDMGAGKIYSYNYINNENASITLPGSVAPVVQSKSDPDVLIAGLDRSIVAVKWNRETNEADSRVLITVSEDKRESHMNDGKADKKGRLWFGTMGDTGDNDEGVLYRIDPFNISNPVPVVTPVNISNGLAWNKANDKFFYIDSPTHQISGFDYDDETGELTNRTVVFDLDKNGISGDPDGMTIDKDDNLWLAVYGGGSVLKVNPETGELVGRFPIPASCVTSVMWGGPDLDILFVTTSRQSLTPEEQQKEPGAGHVYALTNLGTAGLPVFEADIDIAF